MDVAKQKSGLVWIWISACCVTVSVVSVVLLIAFIAFEGMRYFWLPDIVEFQYQEAASKTVPVAGIHWKEKSTTLEDGSVKIEYVLKIGNRRINGIDFRNYAQDQITSEWKKDPNILLLVRQEWGDFIGYLESVDPLPDSHDPKNSDLETIRAIMDQIAPITNAIKEIEKNAISQINIDLKQIKLEKRKAKLQGRLDASYEAQLNAESEMLLQQLKSAEESIVVLKQEQNQFQIHLRTIEGQKTTLKVSDLIRIYQPNSMGFLAKLLAYFAHIWDFLSSEPREANTEGGVFPAIFGTVAMVFIMTVLVTPFGVIAAIYLHEYAKDNWLSRIVRVAVNNLAGVPAVVFGVFGLGFFVYVLGGKIDSLFFPEALPAPTFGTPGLMWASATMALLTLPVVIVSTEEGLARISKSLREGSLALGATRAETLWHLILPMVSPSILTGIILAIARAAGEVAPLMLVGVVKLAPSLPIDEHFPFIHLERKFMHLGFHIFDVGFQSPNVEASRYLVFATSLLLVVLIVILNLAAFTVRNRLRERFRALDSA